MFSATADLYDVIYTQFKDYRTEAAKVAAIIRSRNSSAVTLLDVGCGTGEHARHLSADHGFDVHGIDIERRFVELAQIKNPGGLFEQADMVDFQLDLVYDAIVCLFGSIGYVVELERLEHALASMVKHLSPTGVMVVEPWLEPDAVEDGYVVTATADAPGTKVCRMSHTALDGRITRLRFDYLIGTREGIRRESEVHELGLFTRHEMAAAFQTAGLAVEFDADGLIGRGIYVARRAG